MSPPWICDQVQTHSWGTALRLCEAKNMPAPDRRPLLPRPRMLQTLYDYFWWERLWLPVNLTWADLEDRDGRVYAKASDLYVILPLALLFLIVRYFFEL